MFLRLKITFEYIMTSSLDLFELLGVAALFLPSVSSYKLLHYVETLNESRSKPASHCLQMFLLSDLGASEWGKCQCSCSVFPVKLDVGVLPPQENFGEGLPCGYIFPFWLHLMTSAAAGMHDRYSRQLIMGQELIQWCLPVKLNLLLSQ